ncbi:polysaccharide deacetylase [Candidatus Saccharibacteria bacterium]|nr:polysaccharide deacetylase [Candidatus Saccharibacteria bacterium]
MDEPEIVIEQSKEYRRFRIRGVAVVFFAVLFSTTAVFVAAAISVGVLCDTAVEHKKEAESSSDSFQDIRYTLVGGVTTKEYLSDEEKQAEDERTKKEEEAEKEKEEEKEETTKKVETYVPPSGAKIVYLTFDDGPGPYTEKLLDVLKKYNVKATFFVTCNRANYRNMIKRAYEEGHAIGLHTCSHNYAKVYANDGAYFDDLNDVAGMVKNLTGQETKLVRLPGGSSNTVSAKYSRGIISRITKKLGEEGYVYFDWNVASGDAGNTTSSDVVYNNVTKKLRGDYSVVLQHDIKGFSVDAVEGIIKFGQKYGFTFKALDMNSPTAHHRVNN